MCRCSCSDHTRCHLYVAAMGGADNQSIIQGYRNLVAYDKVGNTSDMAVEIFASLSYGVSGNKVSNCHIKASR